MGSPGRRFGWLLALLALGAACLVAGAASATTLRHMTLAELVAEARVVVRAHSLSNQSRWERGEIWTLTAFEVTGALKGNVPRLITVRTLGGTVGALRSIVEGAPQFLPGEDVYLFLSPDGGQPLQIIGWAQGTFRIRTEAHTGRETVTQDSAGLNVYDRDLHQFRRDGISNLPTALFQRKITALIDAR
jgi:hypothetical protein